MSVERPSTGRLRGIIDHVLGDVGGAVVWAASGASLAWLRDGHLTWLVPLGATIALVAFAVAVAIRRQRKLGRRPKIERELLRQLAAQPSEPLNLLTFARRTNTHSLHVEEAANGLAEARLVEYDYTSALRGHSIRLTPKGNRYVVEQRIV